MWFEYHITKTILSKILGLPNSIFLWKNFLEDPRNQVKNFGTRFVILRFWRLERKLVNRWTCKKLLFHRWIHKEFVEYINNSLNENNSFIEYVNNSLNQNNYFGEYINNSLNQNIYFVEYINNSLNHNNYLVEYINKSLNQNSSFVEPMKLFRWILQHLINHSISLYH